MKLYSLLLILCTACAPLVIQPVVDPNAPVPYPPFPQAEYEALPKTGTGSISGQAFVVDPWGNVKVAAGQHVALIPHTSYSAIWFSNFLLFQRTGVSGGFTDSRMSNYGDDTFADAEGRFKFKSVPVGVYYVRSGVWWKDSAGILRGTDFVRMIRVKEGEEVELVLTPVNWKY